MTCPTPILVTKSPRPSEVSNLHMPQLVCCMRTLGSGRAYTSPLLSGFEVSFKKPLYLMVTVSPFLGIAPLPSWRRVLVTPMIAEVALKLRVERVDWGKLLSFLSVVEAARNDLNIGRRGRGVELEFILDRCLLGGEWRMFSWYLPPRSLVPFQTAAPPLSVMGHIIHNPQFPA